MSTCCFLIIFTIIVVGIIIVYLLLRLYKRLDEKTPTTTSNNLELNIKNDDDEITDTNSSSSDSSGGGNSIDAEILNYVIFSLYQNHPTIRICSRKSNCNFMELCNIHVCKHLLNRVKIQSDKNTLKNVTYIHIGKCIIVFATINDSICSKEQESCLEDTNYINAYTSKFIDFTIYSIFYDKESKKFVDSDKKQHDEYTLSLTMSENEQQQQQEEQRKILSSEFTQPTAPSLKETLKGNIYYITK